nr:hypothetical protein [Vibrio vulnificus]
MRKLCLCGTHPLTQRYTTYGVKIRCISFPYD